MIIRDINEVKWSKKRVFFPKDKFNRSSPIFKTLCGMYEEGDFLVNPVWFDIFLATSGYGYRFCYSLFDLYVSYDCRLDLQDWHKTNWINVRYDKVYDLMNPDAQLRFTNYKQDSIVVGMGLVRFASPKTPSHRPYLIGMIPDAEKVKWLNMYGIDPSVLSDFERMDI